MELIKKEGELPMAYLCIFDKLRELSIGNEVSYRSVKKVLGMVFKIKPNDRMMILWELEMMGLIKKEGLELWQLNKDVKPMAEIRNLRYRKIRNALYQQRSQSVQKQNLNILDCLPNGK